MFQFLLTLRTQLQAMRRRQTSMWLGHVGAILENMGFLPSNTIIFYYAMLGDQQIPTDQAQT